MAFPIIFHKESSFLGSGPAEELRPLERKDDFFSSIYFTIHPSIFLFIHLSIHSFIYPSIGPGQSIRETEKIVAACFHFQGVKSTASLGKSKKPYSSRQEAILIKPYSYKFTQAASYFDKTLKNAIPTSPAPTPHSPERPETPLEVTQKLVG